VTIANLRGAKESGTLFAIPTYGFVASIYIMLAAGFIKCLGGCPQAESINTHPEPASTITLFLVLKAFSAGTTALTVVEAISNRVPAFRYPRSKNAATTPGMMGVMSISMFLGISWLRKSPGPRSCRLSRKWFFTLDESDPLMSATTSGNSGASRHAAPRLLSKVRAVALVGRTDALAAGARGLSLQRHRSLADPLCTAVQAHGAHRVVTVVVPEFIVSESRHRLLHGQTALVIKATPAV
jgi:hypothetical protein